jgi:hypothetical protein
MGQPRIILEPLLDPLPFPSDGSLLFFHFDGKVGENDAMVFYADASTQAGAAVLYVPAGTPTVERPRTAPIWLHCC